MSASTPPRSATTQSTIDSWPWACLGCGATLYHDALFCTECRPRERSRERAVAVPSSAFGRWIRDQSYPSFVAAVTVVASFEGGLTALWLQLLLTGAVPLTGLGG